MTQEQVSELLDLSINYISSVERGIKFPRYENLIALFKGLGAMPNEIFMDEIDAVYEAQASLLSAEISTLAPDEQRRIFLVVETLIRFSDLLN